MVTWDITRDGRAWGDEAMSRYQMTPEKTEMIDGRLYGTEEERLTMLALLLENVGADRAVRLGNASVWRGAVAALDGDQETEAPAGILPEAARDTPEAVLLASVHAQYESLKALLNASSDHWGFEDPVYRFYHQSFKVFWLQRQTDTIVRQLSGLLPDRPLHPWFLQIVRQGTGKEFTTADNDRWTLVTRPIVEAFFHARFFLEMAVRDAAFDDQGVLSPDGRSLAFVSSRSGQADIWILELATGALRNVTNHPEGDFRPSWSPDGQWIAFSSDRDSKKLKFAFATLQTTDIYLVRTDGSGLRRVTARDALAGGPAWSPDGKQVLYHEAEISTLGPERGPSQIVSIDLATNQRQVLTDGGGEKWSPRWIAGDRVAYVSRGPDGGVEFVGGTKGTRGDMRSPAWSADGRRMVFHREVDSRWPPVRPGPSREPSFRLVRTGIFPSYSPTGDRLVVNDERLGRLRNSILVMNADGSQRSVLFGDAERSALAPVWSPQGDRIASGVGRFFQGLQGPSTADIAVMSVDGKEVRILTDGSANYGFPSWSPDGRQLVFRLAGKERNGLVIVDVATGALKTLTAGVAHDNFPSWSPQGDRIAFTSDRDGDYEIYTIRPDGTDLRQLTNSPGNDTHSSWSPDGEWIVFTSVRGGFKDEMALTPFNPQPNGDLWVMRPDGSDVRMLTDDQFEDGTPSWLPMSRRR